MMRPTAPVRCGSLALLLVLLAGYAWGLLVGPERADSLAPVLGGMWEHGGAHNLAPAAAGLASARQQQRSAKSGSPAAILFC